MTERSPYVIGIDLGTTNSALSYVDTREEGRRSIKLLQVLQLAQHGFLQPKKTLPSFCYLLAPGEHFQDAHQLPWSRSQPFVVGGFAKECGGQTPTRLVSSAKSWLCNSSADRQARIVPPMADEELRISPVEATRRYLAHLRDAWNHQMAKRDPDAELQQQELVLTVPASFDEVARTLTAEAAKEAGFRNVTLLEEPQAAFYGWIRQHEASWGETFQDGDCILVCDVGGGTTDFSLIRVQEKEGVRGFERLHVGEHLLLGGDNMDALVAHRLKERMEAEGSVVPSAQWLQLVHQARAAKEELLSADDPEAYHTVRLQGIGSKVVAGSATVTLKAKELLQWLQEGFFALYQREDALNLQRKSGLKHMGLPYESEASITKHLAHFLFGQGVKLPRPTHVLFNGGTMKPQCFQDAVVNSLELWYPGDKLATLRSQSLDLSVSTGAAYYGMTKRGHGVKIRSGLSRTYYLQVNLENEKEPQALTLLPKGTEEGSTYSPNEVFSLKANSPVSFLLLSSQVRLKDSQGHLVVINAEEMQALPPLVTVLRLGKKQQGTVPVRLEAQLTELGTIQLWLSAIETPHRWELHFQVRKAAGQEDSLVALEDARRDEVLDQDVLERAQELVVEALAVDQSLEPGKLMEALEDVLEAPRKQWSLTSLRTLADVALKQSSQRNLSQAIERRWWNLVGFCLRPGMGAPLDDHRLQQLWKLVLAWPREESSQEAEVQKWICARRICAGLNKGHQTQLAHQLIARLPVPDERGKHKRQKGSENYRYSELIRALACLEFLASKLKRKIAETIFSRIRSGQASKDDLWALGRLASRQVLYASSADVLPPKVCEEWVAILLKAKDLPQEWLKRPLIQMVQMTSMPEINVDRNCAEKVIAFLRESEQEEHLRQAIFNPVVSSQKQQEALFGESLPAGLTLKST